MKKQLLRCAGLSAAALLTGTALPGFAQTVTIPETMPLLEQRCFGGPFIGSCVGSRTVTGEVVTPRPDGEFDVEREYLVRYSGLFGVGTAADNNVNGLPGYGFDLSDDYQTSIAADITTSYNQTVRGISWDSSGNPIYGGSTTSSTYSNFSTVLNSLSINMDDYSQWDGRGTYYNVNLSTPDPTAVSGLSVPLSGTMRRRGAVISFSELAGNATLVENPGSLPLYAYDGTYIGSMFPTRYAVRYDVTETVLTQLDQNGLIAPTVTVTDGIEMNGSQVTGLADGVDAGDAVNKGQLDAEAAARVAADAALATNIDAEATARAAADTAIADSITAEATTRGSADVAISQRIDNFEAQRTTLATSLANETNARLAADVDLTNRINAVDARIDMLDNRLGKLDDRLASSTATAIAIQGGAFLPGNRYNLSLNAATYDGAHAGALSFAALVSPKVAVNVSAAHGFNKHGDTGVRAGLTFMW